ncbi:hypothetical protein [Streptomyces olivochromogenes]|uniref:hypothetical protein n=1 Tax=Streptomyces olivochromogenes TaxID=1963 RepID=UPI000B07F029|nr:hypothetical protein [Streptomyces olivochromogenes]
MAESVTASPEGLQGSGAPQGVPATRQAELHLIKQRMQAGKANKARRGEPGFALPM